MPREVAIDKDVPTGPVKTEQRWTQTIRLNWDQRRPTQTLSLATHHWREFSDRRRFIQRCQRQLNRKALFDFGEHSYRKRRISAQIEEILIHLDGFESKQFLPDCH